jgi:hypothetical protein
MPRQNRVMPDGTLIAVPDRGLFWGNRGVLLDSAGRLARYSRGRAWAICVLEFKIDARLHADRLVRPGVRRSYEAPLPELPDGVMVSVGGAPFLVHGGGLLAWTPGGYRDSCPASPGNLVTVITPRATVAVLAVGYRPAVHPSAGE